MGMESTYIWMDGKLVPYEKATVHFMTPALHYGAGVFEGVRAYPTDRGPAIFKAQEHAQRLLDSAHILGFQDLAWTALDLVTAFRDTVRANGFSACYIRPLLYLAEGGWNLSAEGGRLSLGISAWEWPDFHGPEAKAKGIRAMVSSFTRLHPNASMTKSKASGNYVNSLLAKTECQRHGFDDAIMLDPSGYVAECTGENLFVVKRGVIRAVPDGGVLEGITRASLITLAKDAGYAIEEGPVSRDQLYVADEVFACGTAAEVVAFREIDHRRIGSGAAGPVTRALQELYTDAVRGKGRRSPEWLTYIA